MLGLILTLATYTGPALNGNDFNSAKFLVAVRGTAGQSVRLTAANVPPGYIASFCTDRVCAPFGVTLILPRSGLEHIELQYIENRVGARKPRLVSVIGNGRVRASIAFTRAGH